MTEIKEFRFEPKAGAGVPCINYEQGMTVEDIGNELEGVMQTQGYEITKRYRKDGRDNVYNLLMIESKKDNQSVKIEVYLANNSFEKQASIFVWNHGLDVIYLKGSWNQSLKKFKAML